METPDEPDPGHVLTWRQRKVLQVIRASIRERGYPPSMQEIGDAVGLTSQSSVSYQISVLESKGYLRRDGRRPRTVEVRLPGHPPVRPEGPDRPDRKDGGQGGAGGRRGTGLDIPSQKAVRVPLLGQLSASEPIVTQERVDAVMPLPRMLVGEGTVFMFTMTGDSMINAAILDGDWVVVREQREAAETANRDIVAVMIADEATVRTFRRDLDGRVWLMANNPAYAPVDADTAAILGKVVAVIRPVDQDAPDPSE